MVGGYEEKSSSINNYAGQNLVWDYILNLRYVKHYVLFRFLNSTVALRQEIPMTLEICGRNIQVYHVKQLSKCVLGI